MWTVTPWNINDPIPEGNILAIFGKPVTAESLAWLAPSPFRDEQDGA